MTSLHQLICHSWRSQKVSSQLLSKLGGHKRQRIAMSCGKGSANVKRNQARIGLKTERGRVNVEPWPAHILQWVLGEWLKTICIWNWGIISAQPSRLKCLECLVDYDSVTWSGLHIRYYYVGSYHRVLSRTPSCHLPSSNRPTPSAQIVQLVSGLEAKHNKHKKPSIKKKGQVEQEKDVS